MRDEIQSEIRESFADFEWSKRVRADLDELLPLAAGARAIKRAAWAGLGTSVAALATALWFAIGKAADYGEARGAARVREEQRLEDRATLRRVVDADVARDIQAVTFTARLESLAGQVRTLWSLLPGRRQAQDPDQE